MKPINIRSFHTGVLFYRLQAGGSTASMPTMSAPSDISVSTSTDSRHRRPTGSPDSIKLEQVTPPTSPSRQERSLSNPGLHNSMGASDQLYMAPRSNSTSAVSHPVSPPPFFFQIAIYMYHYNIYKCMVRTCTHNKWVKNFCIWIFIYFSSFYYCESMNNNWLIMIYSCQDD